MPMNRSILTAKSAWSHSAGRDDADAGSNIIF